MAYISFFDVEGASLVPDGPSMREKATLLLLQAARASITQFTSRPTRAWPTAPKSSTRITGATARSDAGPMEAWKLAQWGDDVRTFCDVLGIDRPIVFGGLIWRESRDGLCD